MAAATNTKQQHPHLTPPPAAAAVDPKFEWEEKAGSYVLRLSLQGFRKDDFKVQVDGAGRLTVRGTRPGSTLHKVFELPSVASLNDIAGRFEAGMLTLTVPKQASSGAGAAAPPTSIEKIRSKPGVPKEEDGAKPAPPGEVDVAKKMPKEEGAAKPSPSSQQLQSKDGGAGREEADGTNQPAARNDGPFCGTSQVMERYQRMKEEAMKERIKEEANQSAARNDWFCGMPKLAENYQRMQEHVKEEENILRQEQKKLARRAAAMEAKAEQEKKAACGGWKERVVGELKGLTDMKWADGAVEMARKNKEVVAVGVAAFSLGFLVSQKLFRK